MTNTNYRNSTGLPSDDHYTSARDIATLASAVIREYPDFYRWYSQKEFTYNGITQGNRNALLFRDDTVDGMKTGYTETAGYCLVSSAEREGMRMISVVLGTASPAARANESQALLNYGFRFFETRQLWSEGEVVANARVWKGAEDTAELIVREPVYATVPRGNLNDVEAVTEIPGKLIAPLLADNAVGTVLARSGNETVAEANLYSSRTIDEGSLLQSAWDEVLLWFE
jgi:D-alanyl-D-alanine carboxypeptidase (penicillin-binding protein 5/6)